MLRLLISRAEPQQCGWYKLDRKSKPSFYFHFSCTSILAEGYQKFIRGEEVKAAPTETREQAIVVQSDANSNGSISSGTEITQREEVGSDDVTIQTVEVEASAPQPINQTEAKPEINPVEKLGQLIKEARLRILVISETSNVADKVIKDIEDARQNLAKIMAGIQEIVTTIQEQREIPNIVRTVEGLVCFVQSILRTEIPRTREMLAIDLERETQQQERTLSTGLAKVQERYQQAQQALLSAYEQGTIADIMKACLNILSIEEGEAIGLSEFGRRIGEAMNTKPIAHRTIGRWLDEDVIPDPRYLTAIISVTGADNDAFRDRWRQQAQKKSDAFVINQYLAEEQSQSSHAL